MITIKCDRCKSVISKEMVGWVALQHLNTGETIHFCGRCYAVFQTWLSLGINT